MNVLTYREENRTLTGKRIKCVFMNDEYPVESGTEGTVTSVDDIGTIHVKWDNGRTLGLCRDDGDQYELLDS